MQVSNRTTLVSNTILTRQDVDLSTNGMQPTYDSAGLLAVKSGDNCAPLSEYLSPIPILLDCDKLPTTQHL